MSKNDDEQGSGGSGNQASDVVADAATGQGTDYGDAFQTSNGNTQGEESTSQVEEATNNENTQDAYSNTQADEETNENDSMFDSPNSQGTPNEYIADAEPASEDIVSVCEADNIKNYQGREKCEQRCVKGICCFVEGMGPCEHPTQCTAYEVCENLKSGGRSLQYLVERSKRLHT